LDLLLVAILEWDSRAPVNTTKEKHFSNRNISTFQGPSQPLQQHACFVFGLGPILCQQWTAENVFAELQHL